MVRWVWSGLIGCAILLCVNCARAASDCVDAAMQELVAEIGECTAFYGIAAKGMEVTPGAEKQANTLRTNYIRMGLLAATIGKSINISSEATQARIKLHWDEMNKTLANNTGNWPILLLRYQDKCDALNKDALPRETELMTQECNSK
jgi:hypothetical protein